MSSNCSDPTAVTRQPAQPMHKKNLWSKGHRNNWFHGLGTPQKCCLPRCPITIVTKMFAVSCDAMLNYLSQWEVTEYFVGKDYSLAVIFP